MTNKKICNALHEDLRLLNCFTMSRMSPDQYWYRDIRVVWYFAWIFFYYCGISRLNLQCLRSKCSDWSPQLVWVFLLMQAIKMSYRCRVSCFWIYRVLHSDSWGVNLCWDVLCHIATCRTDHANCNISLDAAVLKGY